MSKNCLWEATKNIQVRCDKMWLNITSAREVIEVLENDNFQKVSSIFLPKLVVFKIGHLMHAGVEKKHNQFEHLWKGYWREDELSAFWQKYIFVKINIKDKQWQQ